MTREPPDFSRQCPVCLRRMDPKKAWWWRESHEPVCSEWCARLAEAGRVSGSPTPTEEQ